MSALKQGQCVFQLVFSSGLSMHNLNLLEPQRTASPKHASHQDWAALGGQQLAVVLGNAEILEVLPEGVRWK